jgi:hypothetical protein
MRLANGSDPPSRGNAAPACKCIEIRGAEDGRRAQIARDPKAS